MRATTSVAKARNELLAERIDGSSLDAESEARAAAAYAGYRALSDFELLAPSLLHPGEWLLGTDLAQRPELLALDRLSIVHVEAAFRNAADRLHDRTTEHSSGRTSLPIDHRETARGRQALVDASMAALSWIRAIEQTAFHDRVLAELDDAFDASLAPEPIGDDDRRHPADHEGASHPTIEPVSAVAPRALVRRKLSRVIREATLARDVAILATLEEREGPDERPAGGRNPEPDRRRRGRDELVCGRRTRWWPPCRGVGRARRHRRVVARGVGDGSRRPARRSAGCARPGRDSRAAPSIHSPPASCRCCSVAAASHSRSHRCASTASVRTCSPRSRSSTGASWRTSCFGATARPSLTVRASSTPSPSATCSTSRTSDRPPSSPASGPRTSPAS